jgi:uncharacterized protein YnzC (UPF0291/DUF896 family)
MDTERTLTPAERHYQAQLRATRKYYKKTHPNTRPYVRKVKQPDPQPDPTKPEISGQNGLLIV